MMRTDFLIELQLQTKAYEERELLCEDCQSELNTLGSAPLRLVNEAAICLLDTSYIFMERHTQYFSNPCKHQQQRMKCTKRFKECHGHFKGGQDFEQLMPV